MYIKHTLFYLYGKEKRRQLLRIANRLAHSENKSIYLIIIDMIWCSLHYGAMFTEYDDLNFLHRSNKNRATFITTFFMFKVYDKINLKSSRALFHDKVLFLRTFQSIIKRDWIDVENASKEEIDHFIKAHQKIVFKDSYGDSGKQVKVLELESSMSADVVRDYAKRNNYNLIEEYLYNHCKISELNKTSLNTIRIVTINKRNTVEFLFAGIRVGADGSDLDNISQGGSVARIDLDSGAIDTKFFRKNNTYNSECDSVTKEEKIGFVIPFWDEVKSLAKKAATIRPEIGIVAWDICITEHGPEIIEGNESFGSVIMQLYYNSDEIGLKPRLLSILGDLACGEKK